MTGGPAAAALRGRARFVDASRAGPRDRDRRVQRRDRGARDPDGERAPADGGARVAAAARLRHAHLRRAHALARAPPAARSSRPVRSCCSRTVPTSAAPSRSTQAVAAAKQQHVRIFTVGLRSGAFDAAPLRSLAERTGGSYAEAARQQSSPRSTRRSAPSLRASISSATARRRGRCRRSTSRIEVARRRTSATTAYVAPTPSLLAPFHRSPVSRFLLSRGSPLVLSLLLRCCSSCAADAAARRAGRRPRSSTVSRASPARPRRPGRRQRRVRGAACGHAQPLRDRLVGRPRA